jgi:beta-N-acetylhexosaminidase
METRAYIVGLSGTSLNADERAFFADEPPWGFILFKRNIESPAQVAELVVGLRALAGRHDTPVLIDQEGGRVQRLGPPHCPSYPPGEVYARLYSAMADKGLRAAWLGARLIALDLHRLGINVDCLPLADVPVAGADAVIGDRAYGTNAAQVADIAMAVAEGLLAGGVLPVVKHIPGHGRANADSHLRLPTVETALTELENTDFAAFRPLTELPLAMTAHVVFSAIDAAQPATTSATMFRQVIRGSIGFGGLVMSDDVSMNALSGTIAERTRASFAAGCDVVLHCNGALSEMRAVASQTPQLSGVALQRANAALGQLRAPDALDEAAARAEFSQLMAEANWPPIEALQS